MNRISKICSRCGSSVSLSNYGRHVAGKSCRLFGGVNRNKKIVHPWKDWEVYEGWFRLPCGYEGRKRACANYLINKSLKENGKNNLSNFIDEVKNGVRPNSNKGKPMSEAQKQLLSEIQKKHRAEHPRFHTPESKKRMSEYRKNLHRENPEKHLNRILANNRKKMTYPERVAHDWFQDQMIYAPHNVRVCGFYPDFVVGKNVIVEIDGERWHSSPEQIQSDERRDGILKSNGYIVHRIRSKENIHQRLSEIFGIY